MKFYKDYISERLGQSLLETSAGFVAYKCTPPECFINEFYIAQEFRKEKQGSKELLEKLEQIAIDEGCAFISGVVYIEDPGSSRTLKAAFKQGFKIKAAQNNSVVVVKKVKGD
jgi:GNAT superfamily N-acetyltransferase